MWIGSLSERTHPIQQLDSCDEQTRTIFLQQQLSNEHAANHHYPSFIAEYAINMVIVRSAAFKWDHMFVLTVERWAMESKIVKKEDATKDDIILECNSV